MKTATSIVGALLISGVVTFLSACGDSGTSSSSSSKTGGGGGVGGVAGTYTSVEQDEIKIELKSGGEVVMSAEGMGGSTGTYTVDGEKIIVTVSGQMPVTFIRDGDCIEDRQHVYGKLCKGGKAGAAANVSTRIPPPTTGTYVATNADGEFKIEFKPGNKLTMTFTPAGGQADAQEGTFVIEGDTLHVRLPTGTAMVLNFVNDTYESSAFGLPMKFVKQ